MNRLALAAAPAALLPLSLHVRDVGVAVGVGVALAPLCAVARLLRALARTLVLAPVLERGRGQHGVWDVEDGERARCAGRAVIGNGRGTGGWVGEGGHG